MRQARLAGREQRVASREQTIQHADAEAASQVAQAQAAAAAAYSHARRDLQQEFRAQQDALDRERQALEADRYPAPLVGAYAAAVPFATACPADLLVARPAAEQASSAAGWSHDPCPGQWHSPSDIQKMLAIAM